MGLSYSLLLSASIILWRKAFGPTMADTIDKTTLRSLSFDRKNIRAKSFQKQDSETNPMEEKKKAAEESDSTDSFNICKRSLDSSSENKLKVHEKVQITKPTISLPEPFVFFSPRPKTELDAAATTVQKIYKSYRTRRSLADCAVVVEELWWKTLDSAALKRCSISYFNLEKHETAVSKWARAKTRAAKVGKGLSKDEKGQKLALQHWLEAIDPRHRYGHNLHFYYDKWSESKSTQPFFYWLDIGDGKELNLEKCSRTRLQGQCIKYLGPNERASYEVIVESGKLVYRETGIPIETTEGSKLIFVLSTSRALYVGQKKKGVFQHSSFLSGGATTAAGRLVAHNGVLEAIWPYSGHYLPTEDNFKEFISFLQDHNVDLTNVKKCSVDDDISSYKIGNEESKENEVIKSLSAVNIAATNTEAIDATEHISNGTEDRQDDGTTDRQDDSANDEQPSIASTAANSEVVVFDMNRRLSRKWASGVGARIGCVRDYPADLQSQALEQVNLSPRTNAGRIQNYLPIPSPRPSPKIRVSPRLAYMGIPSPRVSVNC